MSFNYALLTFFCLFTTYFDCCEDVFGLCLQLSHILFAKATVKSMFLWLTLAKTKCAFLILHAISLITDNFEPIFLNMFFLFSGGFIWASSGRRGRETPDRPKCHIQRHDAGQHHRHIFATKGPLCRCMV